MRILLITQLARGHAIAEALARSEQKPELIHVCPFAHPFIKKIATEQHVLDTLLDTDAILDIARAAKPDFAFIEPEEPIVAGLADALGAIGVPCIAPDKAHAQLEASKSFLRDLLERNGIDASPKHRVFVDMAEAPLRTFLSKDLQNAYVIKFDGLKGGKGVKLAGDQLHSLEEAVQFAQQCIRERGRVLIEEKMEGVEFTVSAFVSNGVTVPMPAVQVYKRALENDAGSNTGDMGSVTYADHSLPFLTPEDLTQTHRILQQIVDAIDKETGSPYRGILYGEFMAVRDGVRLIECNVRFGDDALNLLPLLTSDVAAICQAMISGTLAPQLAVFEKQATVCKYVAPKSYPDGKQQIGEPVLFPPVSKNAFVYYGEITQDPDGTLVLGASRTAGVVGIGNTPLEAEVIAESICQKVQGAVRHRKDIGTASLTQKSISLMRTLRGS